MIPDPYAVGCPLCREIPRRQEQKDVGLRPPIHICECPGNEVVACAYCGVVFAVPKEYGFVMLGVPLPNPVKAGSTVQVEIMPIPTMSILDLIDAGMTVTDNQGSAYCFSEDGKATARIDKWGFISVAVHGRGVRGVRVTEADKNAWSAWIGKESPW